MIAKKRRLPPRQLDTYCVVSGTPLLRRVFRGANVKGCFKIRSAIRFGTAGNHDDKSLYRCIVSATEQINVWIPRRLGHNF